MKLFFKFVADESGQDLVEIALMIAFTAGAAVAIMTSLSVWVATIFTKLSCMMFDPCVTLPASEAMVVPGTVRILAAVSAAVCLSIIFLRKHTDEE